MRLLLDTCVFLWFISGDKSLPDSVLQIITSKENEVLLSAVSLWECLLKEKTGGLNLPRPAQQFIPEERERHGIFSLPLDESSIGHLPKLPSIHRDPFDRILICQTMEHGLSLVTSDKVILQYPVKTLWQL